MEQVISITGNTMPAIRAVFRSASAAPITAPTREGPEVHPISPDKARRANIAVPPFGKLADATLSTPGQRIPTEIPQRAHPIRETRGQGEREVIRKDTIHNTEDAIIKLSRLIFSLFLP